MKTSAGRWVGLSLGLAMLPTADVVAKTPGALLGKSVVVTWIEKREQRNEGRATFYEVTANTNFRVYIGTGGHVFSKMAHQYEDGHIGGFEHVAADVDDKRVVIEGRTLTIFFPIGRTARRLIVKFDTRFLRCSASLTYAKQPGVELGRMYDDKYHIHQDIMSISFSDEGCAIREGNVFDAG